MVKTGEEIELDLYNIVRQAVKGKVSGNVYRKDARPHNRTADEDVVVSFLSGNDGQTQRGVVVVNAYVPYVQSKGWDKSLKNLRRTAEVARLLLDIVNDHRPGEYYLQTDRSVVVEEEGSTDVSRVTLRMKYLYNAVAE